MAVTLISTDAKVNILRLITVPLAPVQSDCTDIMAGLVRGVAKALLIYAKLKMPVQRKMSMYLPESAPGCPQQHSRHT